MNVQLFSDALGAINVKYIDEVLTYEPPAKRRPTHIWLKRCIAACLAVVLCFGSFIAVNAEARAAFFGWIKEVYETLFVYRYSEDIDTSAVPGSYEPTLIPDGYSKYYENTAESRITIIYKNEAGALLTFNYIYEPSETSIFVASSDTTLTTTTVNGYTADLLLSNDKTKANVILWTDENDAAFYISAYLDEEMLIKVAESVTATD